MSRKVLEAKRFIQMINQQMEILREETEYLKDGADEFFNRVKREVDTWINGEDVNQTTWAEMTNTIQEHVTFLIAKSVEISGPVSKVSDELKASLTGKSTEESPKDFTHCSTQTEAIHCCEEGGDKKGISAGENSSQIVTMRLAILEEAVFSLKKTTEKVQKDQEKVDTILKDFSTQQENVERKFQVLSESTSKSQQLMQEQLLEAEKFNQINSLNIDTLKESVHKYDSVLNGFEDASKAIYTAVDELSSQLGLVQTLSDRTSVSLQELSKKVESTNQQNHEASGKINKIENSINMLSSKQIQIMRSLSHGECDVLNESIVSRVEEMSKKVSLMEVKFNPPIFGFYAWKLLNVTREVCDITNFNSVDCNFGGSFDKHTGIFTVPLNGLYLVSISIGTKERKKIPDFVCKLRNDEKSVDICYVSGFKSVTRCIAMKTNDKISLEMKSCNGELSIWLHFSGCLITS